MLPIVAIPGTLCDGRLFASLAGLLPAVAPQGSVVDGDAASAAHRLLSGLPARFLLLGFSLGGFVALEVLRRAPDRVAGLVLVSSNGEPAAEGFAQAKQAELDLARRSGIGALIEALWPRYVAPERQADTDMRALIADMAETVGIECLAAQNRLASTRPDSRATLNDCTVPLLAIGGDKDVLCPPHRAACAGPRGRNLILNGAGHFLPLEAPEQLASAIGAWRPS